MSLSFKNLKNPALTLDSVFPSGKFVNCRVRDLLEDYSDYLVWVQKSKVYPLSQEVVSALNNRLSRLAEEQHFREEVQPWLDDFPDVPF